MIKLINRKILKKYRTKNKKRRVYHERLFKKALLANRVQFCHQQIVGNYIVDFAIQDRNLLVEIDGDSHNSIVEKDTVRENTLREWGFEFIRFKNELVGRDTDACIQGVLTYPTGKWKAFYHNIRNANRPPGKKQMLKQMRKKNKNMAKVICGHGRDSKWCSLCRYHT